MLRHRNSTEFNFWQTSVFSNLPIPLRWLFRVSKFSTIQPPDFDSILFDISFRTIQNFSQIRVLFLNSFFELKLSISIKQTFTRYKSFRFCNCTQGICFKSKTTFFFWRKLYLDCDISKVSATFFYEKPFFIQLFLRRNLRKMLQTTYCELPVLVFA